MSRLIVANTVSDVMSERPSIGYRMAMSCVTPRKLWLAQPGDTLVLSSPPSDAFRRYVESVRGVDLSAVRVLAPDRTYIGHVLDLVPMESLRPVAAEVEELLPFALDARSVQLGAELGLRIAHYEGLPDPSIVALVAELNTKHGFREAAVSVGIPVPLGAHFESLAACELGSAKAGLSFPLILKKNRSSNGWANAVVREGSRAEWAAARVETHGGEVDDLTGGWLVEEYLSFVATPSMECIVSDTGVEQYYSCGQRSMNNAWTGMETPYDGVFEELLWEYAMTYGTLLFERGYRGYFDLDCGVVGDDVFATETNVRRTGGTYLLQLARDLTGGGNPYWRADVGAGRTDISFAEAAALIDSAGIGPSAEAPGGAVLTVDTLEVDGKWRYLVAGEDARGVAELESVVRPLLGM